ncbi:helix-turn-helix domain-containing protein [Sphingobium abikonense]|uniref:helix-turn-helix domain-containing protein n=1 Tax=Sphingobium abikonense TaxID=86193 RepID=UPI003518444C
MTRLRISLVDMIRKGITQFDVLAEERYVDVSCDFILNRLGIMVSAQSETLLELGELLRQARLAAGLTQEQVAYLAGISRPRYRDIETGIAAARATTLMNVSRALGLEMMLVPQAMVPAVRALMPPHDDDDLPAFVSQPD